MKYKYHLTHNLKVVGSNPTPATNFSASDIKGLSINTQAIFVSGAQRKG